MLSKNSSNARSPHPVSSDCYHKQSVSWYEITGPLDSYDMQLIRSTSKWSQPSKTDPLLSPRRGLHGHSNKPSSKMIYTRCTVKLRSLKLYIECTWTGLKTDYIDVDDGCWRRNLLVNTIVKQTQTNYKFPRISGHRMVTVKWKKS